MFNIQGSQAKCTSNKSLTQKNALPSCLFHNLPQSLIAITSAYRVLKTQTIVNIKALRQTTNKITRLFTLQPKANKSDLKNGQKINPEKYKKTDSNELA